MSRRIKFNDNFIDSSGVIHEKKLLSEILNESKRFVLWKNNNPDVAVSNGEKLTLSRIDYDEIEVVFKRTTEQYRPYSTGRLPKGYTIALTCSATQLYGYSWIRTRELKRVSDYEFTHTNPTLQMANQNSATTDNTACIPLIIYGYKNQ